MTKYYPEGRLISTEENRRCISDPSLMKRAMMEGKILETDGFYYQFFYNQDRQPVPEQEKSLRHIMLTFETRIYTRSDF